MRSVEPAAMRSGVTSTSQGGRAEGGLLRTALKDDDVHQGMAHTRRRLRGTRIALAKAEEKPWQRHCAGLCQLTTDDADGVHAPSILLECEDARAPRRQDVPTVGGNTDYSLRLSSSGDVDWQRKSTEAHAEG
jgi:hypothetical protein